MLSARSDARGSLSVVVCTLIGSFLVGEALMVPLIGQFSSTPSWVVSLLGAAVVALSPFPVLYVTGCCKLARHLTVHERDACELRRSERRLRQAQLIAGLGSYELDLATSRWTSSDALDGILGIDSGFDRNLDGWFSIVHPNWQEMVERLYRDVLRGSSSRFDLEYEVIREYDGQPRWVHNLGHVERDGWGRPVTLLGTLQDITERKRADAALRLRSEALNAAADAIVIADRTGTIEWVNKALTVSSGYDASEVIGRNPRTLFKSGAQDADFYRRLWKTLLTGGVWQGEMINRRKNGSVYTENVTITPIKNDQGVPTHFIAVKRRTA
jgi:PAS domain S-box-containing protein